MSLSVKIAPSDQRLLSIRVTDVAAIMGLNPYVSKTDVLAKLERHSRATRYDRPRSFAAEYGIANEPVAIQKYESQTGRIVFARTPAVYSVLVSDSDTPLFRLCGSIDGLVTHSQGTSVVEVKCRVGHLRGKPNPWEYIQIQCYYNMLQLWSPIHSIEFVEYNGKLRVTPIPGDQQQWQTALETAADFIQKIKLAKEKKKKKEERKANNTKVDNVNEIELYSD